MFSHEHAGGMKTSPSVAILLSMSVSSNSYKCEFKSLLNSGTWYTPKSFHSSAVKLAQESITVQLIHSSSFRCNNLKLHK